MGTGFLDRSVCHYQDLIRILDDGQGMGNHYHGLFRLEQIGDGLLDRQLVLDVQGCRGLVQQQNRAVLQNGTGDGQPLALPAREQIAVLAGRGIIALFHPADKSVTVGLPAGCLNLRV